MQHRLVETLAWGEVVVVVVACLVLANNIRREML